MLAREGDTGEGVTGTGPVPSVSLPWNHSMECCCRLLASLAIAVFSLNTLLVLAASKAQCLCLFQDVI